MVAVHFNYVIEFGYSSDPNNADSDGDGFIDGDEDLAGTNPNLVGSIPNPSPIIQGLLLETTENPDKDLLVGALKPSHPDGDAVRIFFEDNPDFDGDGSPAFALEGRRVLINDSGDFDYESNQTVKVTIKATSQNSVPSYAEVKVNLLNDRNEDFDGDGLTESQDDSRAGIHIYQWAKRRFPELPPPLSLPLTSERWTERIRPGLSDFPNDPEEAAKTLRGTRRVF